MTAAAGKRRTDALPGEEGVTVFRSASARGDGGHVPTAMTKQGRRRPHRRDCAMTARGSAMSTAGPPGCPPQPRGGSQGGQRDMHRRPAIGGTLRYQAIAPLSTTALSTSLPLAGSRRTASRLTSKPEALGAAGVSRQPMR